MDDRIGLLVIGGGPAGLSAAKAYRRHGGDGRVLLVSADTALPYNRPPLSKDFLRGESGERDLPLESPQFYRDNEIDAVLGSEVTRLDPDGEVAVLSTGEAIGYRACVLATGSQPRPMPVPGADHPSVRQLRSLTSGRELVAHADAARSAVVLGSGFIGCEAAASLARRGLAVTLVSREAMPQQARLGAAAGARLAEWLAAEGVTLVLDTRVDGIDDGRRVRLPDRAPVEADLVLMAGGVTPRGELAEAAGLHTEDGRVVVDERMRSSAPAVYAAGDVAYAHNAAAGRRLRVEHWGEALTMGEIAGTVAAGGEARWANAPGFWTTVGDRTLKYAAWGDGFDEARLVEHGADGFTVWYGRDGVLVGVLTADQDDDYERGTARIERAARFD